MASIKFSAFTNEAVDAATTQLVGYKVGDTSANYRYSVAQLATALSPSINTFYSADGTIATSRVATITDTPKFQGDESTNIGLEINNQYNSSMSPSSGGSKLLLSSGTSGITTLELRANRTGNGGSNASSTFINSSSSLIFSATNTIGWMYQFKTGSLASLNFYGTNSGSTLRIGSNGGSTPNRIDLGWDGVNSGYIGVTGNTIGLGDNSGGTLTENLTILSGGDVGIGQTSPTEKLEVAGNVKIDGQAYTELHTEASAATITPDWDNGNIYTTELTSASTTFADPTNIKPGATYIIILKQDGTGSRTVSWGTKYKFPGGTAPTLTTGANKADVITLVAYSTDILMCTSVLDFVTS